MARNDQPRIAIIGGGPIGLEAALRLSLRGLRYTLFERGEPGEHVGQWGHIRMFSPFGWNVTEAGIAAIRHEDPRHEFPEPGELVTGNDFRDSYLTPLGLTAKISEQTRGGCTIMSIGRSGCLRTDPYNDPRRVDAPFRILYSEKSVEQVAEADIILDCSGTWRHYRFAGDGGIPAMGEIAASKFVIRTPDDVLGAKRSIYAGKSIAVIGGGFSAATTVCALAALAEEESATWVIWLTRSLKSTPLPRFPGDPLRERDKLAAKANSLATRGDGNLEHHSQTRIQSIVSHGQDKGFQITAKCAGKEMIWEVDRVVTNVGYRPDPLMTAELVSGEPNYYILGAKGMDRDSNFLLKQGYEQVAKVVAGL